MGTMTERKNNIHVTFDQINDYDEDCSTINQLRDRIDQAEQKAKQMGFNIVFVQIDSSLEFFNVREETDEEFNKRIEDKRYWEEQTRKQEYQQYLRLKEKFEPQKIE
jgi:hypothetical protein